MSPVFIRRSTAFLSLSAVVLTLLPAASMAFSDVSADAQYSTAINALYDKGVISGYADNSFKAASTINRAEFLKIVLEARAKAGASTVNDLSGCFDDVAKEWFAKYVCTAKSEGIVAGYAGGDFRPGQDITFVEAGKILALAFGQSPENVGGEWYEQYVRALESSKAIAPTVNAFDKKLTRGEMAEMMWRLIDKRTDQPTKGYLNIKYPEVAVNLASDEAQLARSCRDLEAFAAESQTSGGRTDYFYGDGEMLQRGMANDVAAGAPAPTAANESAKTSLGGSSGGGYSQTNVQVAGVDEGDIVKTDGTYIYVVDRGGENAGRTVQIIKAVPGSAMQKVATVDLGDKNASIQEIYVDGNTLVAVGQGRKNMPMPYDMGVSNKMIAPGGYYGGNSTTLVRTWNIADKANPKTLRSLSFDGSRVSTRRIGTKLYVVMQQGMPYWGGPIIMPMVRGTEKDLLPMMTDSAKGTASMPVTRCGDVTILPHIPRPQYLVVSAIPTDSATKEVKSDVILGSAQLVYSSLNNLYVGAPEWNYVWDGTGRNNVTTTVYRFQFDGEGATLKAKGSVPGTALNQFSMDEHENSFRIATTESVYDNSGSHTTNNLYVLNMNMEQVGEIGEIAPGETIYSVRFMGDRTYMVTFKRVDPLFVIDTSDPRNPRILGKLKIQGYSDYLHPYDETHLIGFGKEVDESIDADKVHDNEAVYYTAIQGMKVSLFDVSDVANPKEMFKTVIGDRGTESPLLHDHHALLFEKDRNLLSFPVTVYSAAAAKPQPGTSETWPVPVFQGAYVYDISLTKGFQLKGRISHYGEDAYLKSGDTWYPYGKDVERVLRIGESLYSVSMEQIQSHALSTLSKLGDVSF